ncbi:hypothetical protein [Pukyongiella litopenaei]|uniref:DUF2946 domain-containing protein n=1 Tax=Pukyongiella litopenaei TaxID=2605946 RepID=A0A2S0MS80_9RHOB|nr:hypothetical protein [Pukyongiella litopenaei]AVO38740.1 hypothetical protein C6Y53_14255 [Pukyongiella litopenaei]
MAAVRTYLVLMLAAVLALTGAGLAAARGAPAAAGRIEICTGTGPVMILVDEDGQPVGPRLCPDNALSLLNAVFIPVLPDDAADIPRRIDRPRGLVQLHPRDLPPTQARAPPVPV